MMPSQTVMPSKVIGAISKVNRARHASNSSNSWYEQQRAGLPVTGKAKKLHGVFHMPHNMWHLNVQLQSSCQSYAICVLKERLRQEATRFVQLHSRM